MARHHAGQVTFLGVPSSDSLDNMRAFVDRHGLASMGHAVDLDREVWNAFGIPAQPAWVFVSPDGETTRHLGALYGDGLTDALLRLLDS